jgi:hypothetical protein
MCVHTFTLTGIQKGFGLFIVNRAGYYAMPTADFRNWVLSPETFLNNTNFLFGSEFATGGLSDLFDNILGHGRLLLQCAMTSFGEPDGNCQASSKVSLVFWSKSLPFLLMANTQMNSHPQFQVCPTVRPEGRGFCVSIAPLCSLRARYKPFSQPAATPHVPWHNRRGPISSPSCSARSSVSS